MPLHREPESALVLRRWLKTNGGDFHHDAIYSQGNGSNFPLTKGLIVNNLHR